MPVAQQGRSIHLIAPLFVPATRPERFAKAATSGTDAIIIDLEDAVAPADKARARDNLGVSRDLGVKVFVRINSQGSPWFHDDLAALRSLGITRVCVPKVDSVQVLDIACAALGRDIRILPLIETPAGVINAPSIAAHPAVGQLAFGPADFFSEMGCSPSDELSAHALRVIAIASRASAIALPLDGPCFSATDSDLVADECAFAKANGAGGKLCIHPAQVSVAMRAFLPSVEELRWAQRVVDADQCGAAQIVDGKMIDAPIVARARSLLDLSARFAG